MNRKPSEWLEFVKAHVDEGVPMTKIAADNHIDLSKLKYKVKVYELHGETPFTDDQAFRVYTREEKLNAIHKVLNGEKSGRQMALELGTPDADTVREWVKLYEEKGEEGIQISRGRKKYLLHEDRQKYLANKELNQRLKFLEDENEILKKSLALAFKKDKRLKKKYESLTSSRAKSN